MKINIHWVARPILSACAVLVLISCSGHRVGRPFQDLSSARSEYDLKSPVKIFKKDGTIYLFKEGATMTDSVIVGRATMLTPDGSKTDSVSAIIASSEMAGATLYKFQQSVGSQIGAVWSGAFGGASAMLALICITDPKSCFGSCPTVYVPVNGQLEMVAELFSTSISPSLARDDLDRLCGTIGDSTITIMVTNEALESHYIDKLHYIYVEHGSELIALPRPDRSIAVFDTATTAVIGRTSDGYDITHVLSADDGQAWRSGPDALLMRSASDPFDYIDIAVPTEGEDSVDLVIRWRNTLLSTVLFYNMVLGDQGLGALRWQERLDKDPLYSMAFATIYDQYSGLRLSVAHNNTWVNLSHLTDAGPIVWRTEAVRIPTYGQDTLIVRTSCLADNVLIDKIARIDLHPSQPSEVTLPYTVSAASTPSDTSVNNLLSTQDRKYVLHEPGDAATFNVHLPRGAASGSIFARSNGFYYEWIRNGWLQNTTQRTNNDVINTNKMITDLGRRWMDHHLVIEDSFQKSRIPLRKP